MSQPISEGQLHALECYSVPNAKIRTLDRDSAKQLLRLLSDLATERKRLLPRKKIAYKTWKLGPYERDEITVRFRPKGEAGSPRQPQSAVSL